MKLLQVDIKGETVADLGPPVPDDTPANLDITVTARSVPRPSLEVETEVHSHLAPRIEAHLRRILGWDLSDLPEDTQREIASVATSVRDSFRALGLLLANRTREGFVAKTTATGRKRAALKCAIGKKVQLRVDIGDSMCGLFYTAEELSALTLSKVGESSVLVTTAGGREIGPLPFAHVELVDG
jgi:hypothetical protein